LYDPTSYTLFNFTNFFKRKFKYNLQNKQKLSLFYGKLRKNYLKNLVKSTKNEFKTLNTQATSLFIKKLETRLDTTLYRARFSYSLSNARQLILHKKIYVNHKIVQYNSYTLKKGDLITVDKNVFEFVLFNITSSKT
jgi:small subunit ribosomal protein S4